MYYDHANIVTLTKYIFTDNSLVNFSVLAFIKGRSLTINIQFNSKFKFKKKSKLLKILTT